MGGGLRLHPTLLLLAFHSVPAQQPRAQSVVNPHWHTDQTACSHWWGLLPALEARQRETESRSGATGCVAPAAGGGDASPALLSVQAAPGPPLLQESPRLQSCPAPTKGDERMRGSQGEGSAKNHPDIWCYQLFPWGWGVQTPGPNHLVSWMRNKGPFCCPFPRGPGTTPMKWRHLCLPPAPGDSREVEAGRLARGPQASPAPSTFLAFLTSSWQQGDPALPANSWALPAACVQLGFLPVCVRESACGGVTTGAGPGCQGGQKRSGVSPTAGPGGQSQPISFHCL